LIFSLQHSFNLLLLLYTASQLDFVGLFGDLLYPAEPARSEGHEEKEVLKGC